jgi:hypothetical protein
MFGSIPRISRTSRPVSSGRARKIRVVGQVSRRTPSSSNSTSGRFTWKS